MGGDHSRDRPIDGGDRRRVVDRARLPSARAIVGGLLLALSGVATFVAWQHAAGAPDHSYLVADQDLTPGQRLAADDLRLAPIDLPDGVAAASFTDADAVVGRVALGPIGDGELIQAAQVSDGRSTEPVAEVALALPRDRAVDGQLRSGDRVDVFVTYPDQTRPVADDVPVVAVNDNRGGFTDGSQVTVTLALGPADRRAELIHAVRVGEVTLVRSTLGGGEADAATDLGIDSLRPMPGPGEGHDGR